MSLLDIIRKALKPKKQSVAPSEEKEKINDERLRRAVRLKKLIDSDGYQDMIALIDDYIEKCLFRKLKTRLDTCDDRELSYLRLIDHEVFILQWVKDLPRQFVEQVEKGDQKNEDDRSGQ